MTKHHSCSEVCPPTHAPLPSPLPPSPLSVASCLFFVFLSLATGNNSSSAGFVSLVLRSNTFYKVCIVPMENSGCFFFPGESQLRQSRATQPKVHAGCFSVSIIHRTLTWTTGSLVCAQMLMHAIAHQGVRTHVRDCALKVDSGRKIPCCTGESNLCQRRDSLML